MFTARSILFLAATSTATQCSAALPTMATTNTPTKNWDRPIFSEASLIEPTRISDITPTATADRRQVDGGPLDGPLVLLLLLAVAERVEHVPVRLQREVQPGGVAHQQHERHAERQVLEVRPEVHLVGADGR